MLRIPCPYCGLRDESEFLFGGPSQLLRPPYECSDQEWSDYLYMRDNPQGVYLERWCHLYGCRRWFNISRDTLTHQITTAHEET